MKIRQTDSIIELAHFWDTHDLTDFEDQLAEVRESVFEREANENVHLQPDDQKNMAALTQTVPDAHNRRQTHK